MLGVFKRWLKSGFLQKPLTKDTAQIALFLVFEEVTNAKKDLCTHLRLTPNGNYVGWAEVRVLTEYSIARGYRRNRQSRFWSKNKDQIT